MTPETLESRVARLEQQIQAVVGVRTDSGQPGRDDWMQTVGMFRDDAIVAEMIELSQQMRDEDRRRARDAEGPAA